MASRPGGLTYLEVGATFRRSPRRLSPRSRERDGRIRTGGFRGCRSNRRELGNAPRSRSGRTDGSPDRRGGSGCDFRTRSGNYPRSDRLCRRRTQSQGLRVRNPRGPPRMRGGIVCRPVRRGQPSGSYRDRCVLQARNVVGASRRSDRTSSTGVCYAPLHPCRPRERRPIAGMTAAGRAGKMIGRASVRVDSLCETVTTRQEVRPMNAVTMWVLPLVFTDRRLT